jgi:hypothetical protein
VKFNSNTKGWRSEDRRYFEKRVRGPSLKFKSNVKGWRSEDRRYIEKERR